jgi:hypothetical protein
LTVWTGECRRLSAAVGAAWPAGGGAESLQAHRGDP